MSFLSNFEGIPPFPDDVQTAPLVRLSLVKLLQHDKTETDRFFKACKEIGFFYLDLRTAPCGDSILRDADKLFNVSEELFNLTLEEKQQFDYSKEGSSDGYKGHGAALIDKDGNLDRNEFYNVSKNDIIGVSGPVLAPDVLSRERSTLRSFINNAHSIVVLVLCLLNQYLNLEPETLEGLHRLHKPSCDQVRFIKAPPQPIDDRKIALGEHTDFGSVTVLFNRVGGLQVLPPGREAKWLHVRPLPGHAIINLGDAMVKFTNGLLRSNIHRVVSPPGAQADITRYSLVYFARPEDDVKLRRLEGSECIPPLTEGIVEEDINSKDWVNRRALGHRVALHKKVDFEKTMGTETLSRRA